MKTIYDLISVALFAGLAILYLQRSASDEPDTVELWKYAVAAVGCAVADYLGNNNKPLAAAIAFVALIVFSLWALKPFERSSSR